MQRSAVQEYGPTLATQYPELATLTDADLIRHGTRELVVAIEMLRKDGGEITRERLLREVIATHKTISLMLRHAELKQQQADVEAGLAELRARRRQMLSARQPTSA